MLSFQRDGQSQAPAAAQAQQAHGEKEDGLCKQDDFLTVSGHGKKVRQSTLMLVGLFVVAAAVVWFMVKKITPASVSAAPGQDQSQLEAALAQLSTMQNEVNTQMDSVVGKFYQFDSVEQVEVSELKKNPFQRELGKTEQKEDLAKKAENDLKQLRDRAYQQAASLELWSITATPRGKCCMINDKLLYLGDSINELTVKTIGEKTVALEYNGVLVELKMTE